MPKKHKLDEKLYCMQKNCMQYMTLPVHHDTFRQWSEEKVYVETGWYISPAWVREEGWDGMIFCPDHEVEGEDYAGEYEDNSDG